jgi:tetratricopeptide (TPR) repeat protein
LGEVSAAVASGEAAIEHADRSGDGGQRMINRTTLADARHQAGEVTAAQALFKEAEVMQAEDQPAYPRLYSLRGYQYCDLLLTLGQAEAVRERAGRALKDSMTSRAASASLLDIALDHLSLGRAEMALGDRDEARHQLDQAVDGLREAGQIHELPRGLLVRAAFFCEVGECQESRLDLDEAVRIAERGGMRLHHCDVHLGYARLALAEGRPDDISEHLKSAKTLVRECGYHRRDGEVEALEKKLGL